MRDQERNRKTFQEIPARRRTGAEDEPMH
jgi:hypothetical protein